MATTEWHSKVISPEKAASLVKNDDFICMANGCAGPLAFIDALTARAHELRGVKLNHAKITSHKPLSYIDPALCASLMYDSFAFCIEFKKTMQEGAADYVPVGYRDVAVFIEQGVFRPDVTVFQISPPDQFGYCSYGLTASYLPAAIAHSRLVMAEVNPHMPRTGGARVHVNDIHYLIDVDYPIPSTADIPFGEVERRIGEHIASLVEDGSTLQLGVGAIPNAALACLAHHKDLGIHSETYGDAVVDLLSLGVITGRRKTRKPGLITATFVTGSSKTHDFARDNMMVDMQGVHITNDPHLIAMQDKMIAINSAVEVDVTGQICAESIGTLQISGTGGQMDFALGALHSKGGKFIIALPSTAAKGTESRITAMLKPGAGVSTPRTLADYVVTEYGIAELRGKNIRQRARALINIAHPDFRENIEREARARKDVYLD